MFVCKKTSQGATKPSVWPYKLFDIQKIKNFLTVIFAKQKQHDNLFKKKTRLLKERR